MLPALAAADVAPTPRPAPRVTRLSLADAAQGRRWDAFVHRHPQATFFHRLDWLRCVERVWSHEAHALWVEDAEGVRGVLPLARMRTRLFGDSLVSVPFGVYGGVVADDEAAATALETHATQLAHELGVDHLELRNLAPRHADWPRQDLYVTFRKPITASDDENLNAIPRKQRAMVRKGIKNGLLAAADTDAARFFEVYADNVHRHGTPAMPRRWFQALMDTFGQDATVLTVTSPEGVPVSSVLTFWFRDEVLPYYAGDHLAARDLAANDFKYWALMQQAALRGARLFDYGRSKLGTGPYAFKKNWGFEPTPLSYEFQLVGADAVPQHNPTNAKYRMLIDTWKRLPRAVVDRLGPPIVRGLG